MHAAGGDAHAVTLDVTDPATIQDAAKEVEERFGHLDVLINNAGMARPSADVLLTAQQQPSRRATTSSLK